MEKGSPRAAFFAYEKTYSITSGRNPARIYLYSARMPRHSETFCRNPARICLYSATTPRHSATFCRNPATWKKQRFFSNFTKDLVLYPRNLLRFFRIGEVQLHELR